MAKCKALTGLALKGLKLFAVDGFVRYFDGVDMRQNDRDVFQTKVVVKCLNM